MIGIYTAASAHMSAIATNGIQVGIDNSARRRRRSPQKQADIRPDAIAAVRDKDKGQATRLLSGLHDQFPENGLFVREIERLQMGP